MARAFAIFLIKQIEGFSGSISEFSLDILCFLSLSVDFPDERLCFCRFEKRSVISLQDRKRMEVLEVFALFYLTFETPLKKSCIYIFR